MGGWLTFVFLVALLYAGVFAHGPTEAEIKAACKGHGKVVSYTSDNVWSLDPKARVVCKDGAIRYVEN